MLFHIIPLVALLSVAAGGHATPVQPAVGADADASALAPPSCGGLAGTVEWAAGDAAGSDLSIASDALDVRGVVPNGGSLARAFVVSEAVRVRLEAAGAPLGDPWLSVLDEMGNELASDDDSGGARAARIETLLPAGRYCALARGYDFGAIAAVDVRLGRAEHEPLTAGAGEAMNPGCDVDEPAYLAEGPLAADALADGVEMTATATAVPAWRFDLAEPAALTITARSPDGDPRIRLVERGGGVVLAENDDADGLDSRVDLADPLPAGAYCLEVTQLNEGGPPVTVRLSAFDRVAHRLRGIAAAEFSPLPGDGVTVRDLEALDTTLVADVFGSGAKAAWLRFDLPEAGLLVLEAVGADVDPTVVLFDRVGRRLAENDDGPSGRDSFLAQRLPAGGYLLAVRLVDGQASGNVRLLLERYVPAR